MGLHHRFGQTGGATGEDPQGGIESGGVKGGDVEIGKNEVVFDHYERR